MRGSGKLGRRVRAVLAWLVVPSRRGRKKIASTEDYLPVRANREGTGRVIWAQLRSFFVSKSDGEIALEHVDRNCAENLTLPDNTLVEEFRC